jgi:hypothetical protein
MFYFGQKMTLLFIKEPGWREGEGDAKRSACPPCLPNRLPGGFLRKREPAALAGRRLDNSPCRAASQPGSREAENQYARQGSENMNDQAFPEKNTHPTGSPSQQSSRPKRFWPIFWGILVLLGVIFLGNGMNSTRPERSWSTVLRVLIGLILISWGLFCIWDTVSFLPGAVSAQGTVLSCHDRHSRGSRWSCSPRVSFQTASGERREFTGSRGEWHKGEQETVWYHLKNPSDARLGTWQTGAPLLGGFLLIIAGLLLVGFTLFTPLILRILQKRYPEVYG